MNGIASNKKASSRREIATNRLASSRSRLMHHPKPLSMPVREIVSPRSTKSQKKNNKIISSWIWVTLRKTLKEYCPSERSILSKCYRNARKNNLAYNWLSARKGKESTNWVYISWPQPVKMRDQQCHMTLIRPQKIRWGFPQPRRTVWIQICIKV